MLHICQNILILNLSLHATMDNNPLQGIDQNCNLEKKNVIKKKCQNSIIIFLNKRCECCPVCLTGRVAVPGAGSDG